MLRPEIGRWRQLARYRLIFEDLPDEKNQVKIDPAAPNRPIAYHRDVSSYAKKSIDALESLLSSKLLNALPVERIEYNRKLNPTESHILGTTVMGNDAETSVIDRHLVHHNVRNLLALGSGSFPTCSPANPTLTISALSLWAAAHLGVSSRE